MKRIRRENTFLYFLLYNLLTLSIILTSATLFLTEEYKAVGALGLPLDDSWIHFRFAQNLADGHGFSFNKGVPIGSSTAPLWTVILALVYKLIGELMISSFVLGLLLFWLSGLLVYALSLWLTENVVFAFATGLITVSLGRLTWGALSGMESMLSTFLTLLGIYLYLRDQRPPTSKSLASTVVFALAGLTRPESYLLFFISILDRLLVAFLFSEERIELKSFALNIVKHFFVFLIIVSPYAIFCYLTSGSIFPHTFAAKVGRLGLFGNLSAGNWTGLYLVLFVNPKYYLERFFGELRITNPFLSYLLVPGFIYLFILPYTSDWRIWGVSPQSVSSEQGLSRARWSAAPAGTDGKISKPRSFLLPLILIFYPLVVGMVVPSDRVSWPWFRHIINLFPLLAIIGLLGLLGLLRLLRYVEEFISSQRQRAFAASNPSHQVLKTCFLALRLALFLLLMLLMTRYFIDDQRSVSSYYTERVSTMQREHLAMARWINENVPPAALLALSDIGAITFLTDREIIDIEGLVTPELRLDNPRHSVEKDMAIFRYLKEKKADYFVTFYWLYSNIPPENRIPLHQEGNLMIYKMIYD